MARPVLISVRMLVLLLSIVPSLALAAAEPSQPCSPVAGQDIPERRQKEFIELQKAMESGAFYQELVRRFGLPQSCQDVLDGDNLGLTYAFRGNARLEARSTPSIEFSEQRLQLSGLTSQSALTLLKAAEKSLYGDEGCGIRWKQPRTEVNSQHPTSSEWVYQGTTCNCQARVTYDRKAIVALLIRSAC